MTREIDANELLWRIVFIREPGKKGSYYGVHLRRDSGGIYLNIGGKKTYLKSGDEVLTRLRPEEPVRLKCDNRV